MHKSGFVNIVGLPNVGKSSLLNKITGERLSIISPKAQTTRSRLISIVNADNYQIVFSDTPGYINQPAYELQSSMNQFVHEAFEDADLIILLTDRFQSFDDQAFLIEQARKTSRPVFVVINKADLSTPEQLNKLYEAWSVQLPAARCFSISVKEDFNIKPLFEAVLPFLPEHEAYYSKEEISDRSLRYFASEIVREHIFLQYEKEIPYACEVLTEEYKEGEKMDRIRCVIYVERESQKNIIIGSKGSAINNLGRAARLALEEFLGKKVFLDLFVKVRANWRANDIDLKQFGYKS
jgi:GTP-binding protein Era